MRRVAFFALMLWTASVLQPVVSPGRSDGGRGSTPGKAQRIARHVTRDLNGILSGARSQLIELAQLPSVQAANPTSCTSDVAARAVDPRYTALGAASLSGNVYCLSIPFTPPLSIADRAYFLRAIGTGDLGVGDFQVGRVTGQGSVGLGYPVLAGGRATGIVLSTLSTTWLDQRLEADRHGARDLLVVDDHGTLVAHAGATSIPVGTNLGAVALIKKMLNRDRGAVITRFGGRVRAAFDTVPLSDDAMHVAATIKRSP